MPTKICSVCKRELEANTINFNKHPRCKFGLSNKCKECTKKYKNQYHASHRDDELKYKKAWYSNNKERHQANIKTYHEKHKEEIKMHRKLYMKSVEGKEKIRINNQKRRSQIYQLPTPFNRKQWEECKQYFKDNNGKLHCAYCGQVITKATQEHFIPISKGGEYAKSNILPVCGKCNSSKQEKDFYEWYSKQLFYSKERIDKIMGYLGYKGALQQFTILDFIEE
jgi:hypothetical protein